jgi:integrase
VRVYIGEGRYKEKSLATADDIQESNGSTVLTFDQAQQRARSVAKGLAAGDRASLAPVTVTDAMTDYLEFQQDHRKSYEQTRTMAEAHIKPSLGRLLIAELTTQRVRKWHSDLAKTPARLRGEGVRRHSPKDAEAVRRRRATANRVLTVLKAALNYAFREDHVDDDTAWRRVKPFANVDAPRVRFLTLQESQRLVNSAGPYLRPLVRAALLTGARYGELGALEVADYDARSGTIYIRESKGGHPRHVPLTDEGQDFFEEIAAGRSRSKSMFVQENGKPWGKSHQSRPLKIAAAKAKLSDVSFHILRHTYGSFLAAEGVPLQVIAAALGHADTRTTEKHYAHLLPNFVADTIRANLPTFIKEEPKVRQLR